MNHEDCWSPAAEEQKLDNHEVKKQRIAALSNPERAEERIPPKSIDVKLQGEQKDGKKPQVDQIQTEIHNISLLSPIQDLKTIKATRDIIPIHKPSKKRDRPSKPQITRQKRFKGVQKTKMAKKQDTPKKTSSTFYGRLPQKAILGNSDSESSSENIDFFMWSIIYSN